MTQTTELRKEWGRENVKEFLCCNGDYCKANCAEKKEQEIFDFFSARTIPLSTLEELETEIKKMMNYPCTCERENKKCEHKWEPILFSVLSIIKSYKVKEEI